MNEAPSAVVVHFFNIFNELFHTVSIDLVDQESLKNGFFNVYFFCFF